MSKPRPTILDPDVRLLTAPADPTRLAIVRELAGSTETCACDLTSCCDVRQPTVSHHLRVLREAGIVTSERRGQVDLVPPRAGGLEPFGRTGARPGPRRPDRARAAQHVEDRDRRDAHGKRLAGSAAAGLPVERLA